MPYKYSRELLAKAVAEAKSWADVCRAIGVKPSTGGQSHLANRCRAEGLDHSHFVGQASNKGKVFGPKRPIEEYLSNLVRINSHALRMRLLKEGVKEYRCECCRRKTWNGKPINLELDHINGEHGDNRLENLRILCPNCHSQTETYCGKNRRRVA